MPPKKRKTVAKKPETITLSTGDVSVVSEAKGLRISYNEADMPVVVFQGGPWTGKDIRLVIAAIPRAYRLHKLTVRRQGVTK
jgi:hypothetical protein